MEIPATAPQHGRPIPEARQPTDHDRATAIALESLFLSEMLKHAGLGEARQAFGGGVGEEQFSSLLRDIQAREIAETSGIGLAEHILRSLTRERQ